MLYYKQLFSSCSDLCHLQTWSTFDNLGPPERWTLWELLVVKCVKARCGCTAAHLQVGILTLIYQCIHLHPHARLHSCQCPPGFPALRMRGWLKAEEKFQKEPNFHFSTSTWPQAGRETWGSVHDQAWGKAPCTLTLFSATLATSLCKWIS